MLPSSPSDDSLDPSCPLVGKSGRVSVIIPAFNASEYLPLSINSVLKQTHKVDEIVVVDDGSTDATRDVVMEYANEGVRYIWQANQGSASARNKGIEVTSGEYVAFLDADDAWLPKKVELQLRMFEKSSELILVSGDQIFWDEDRSIKKLRAFSKNRKIKDCKTEIIFENIIGNPSMTMIKRFALEKSGSFDPKIRFGDDWDMWIRLMEWGEAAFVPEPVSIYRWHEKSLSQSNRKECLASYRKICRRGITRTIPPLRRPLAFTRLIKHSEALYNYRTLRGRIVSWVPRILRAPKACDEITS